jgi:hypothetical protein
MSEPSRHEDEGASEVYFLQQFAPEGEIEHTATVIGMWLLDLVEAEGRKPLGGVVTEVFSDLDPPAPAGWAAFRVTVHIDEQMIDVEV